METLDKTRKDFGDYGHVFFLFNNKAFFGNYRQGALNVTGIFNVPTIWLRSGVIHLIISLPYWSFLIWTCSFNAHYHPNYHQVIGRSYPEYICIVHPFVPLIFDRKERGFSITRTIWELQTRRIERHRDF